ncbi:MAG TPA: hypothetical protein VI197_17400 [Polyangiaceae bacterium]
MRQCRTSLRALLVAGALFPGGALLPGCTPQQASPPVTPTPPAPAKTSSALRRAAIHGLSQVAYDTGPHSLTRTVLRYRLRQMATAPASDAAQHQQAIRTLWYLRERGTLLALADGTSPGAELARVQAELLLKPEAACEECPNDE